MNILHINPQLEIIWGMEKYIEVFYNEFQYKYNQFVLKIIDWKSNIKVPNEKIYSLDKKAKNIFQKIIILTITPFQIAIFCRKKNINYSISHGDYANILNVLSKLFWNPAKIILIFHNTVNLWLLGWPIYTAIKILARFADKILTVSKELKQDVTIDLQISKSKISTIYNPFDFNEINRLQNEPIESEMEQLLDSGKINFCNIARIESYKKQDLLLEYFAEYQKKSQNAFLFFIWDGNYRKVLEYKAKELNIDNSVFFLWFKENIYGYVKKMHAHCFCSGLQEWFGRSLIDTLFCGVPVLTHDYKYWAKEIMRGDDNLSECNDIEILDNGILTPYMNKEKYIKWMEMITKIPFDKEKMRENITRYGIEYFVASWNDILI